MGRKSNKVHADRDSTRANSGGSEAPSQAGGRTSRRVSTSAAGGNSVVSTSELQLTSGRKASSSNVSSGSRPVRCVRPSVGLRASSASHWCLPAFPLPLAAGQRGPLPP